MAIIYLSKQLFLFLSFLSFFSLITISLSFTCQGEQNPVTFTGHSFNIQTNKLYLYIISNSSFFSGSGTYEFTLNSYSDLLFDYFYYTQYNLTDCSYDFINALHFSFYSSKIQKSSFGFFDTTTKYYYKGSFKIKEKTGEYFIFQIPIYGGIDFIDSYVYKSTEKDKFQYGTLFIILLIIIPLFCLSFCICLCCYICRSIRKPENNNNLNNFAQEIHTVPEGPVIGQAYTPL